MIAEYERAKIMERCRRGKQHAARRGSVNVLSGAPYGYRYVGKHEGGGEARYQVLAEEARVVRKIFEWVGRERCSIGEVCRRLQREGIPTRTGKPAWDRATVWLMLKNPAYKGTAAFGKTRAGASQAAATSARSVAVPEQPQATRLSGRYIIGRSNLHRRPRLGERGTLRGGPGSTRGEPATPPRPARWRPLPAARLGRLQTVRLRLLRQTERAEPRPRARIPYAYYRCTGSDAYRFGGQRLCWNKQIRTDMLGRCGLGRRASASCPSPRRVRAEYERRLRGIEDGPEPRGGASQQS